VCHHQQAGYHGISQHNRGKSNHSRPLDSSVVLEKSGSRFIKSLR
jgi:hypothetical protein